ncbi:MAG: superoxide dismutase [Ni] [Elusimicrobiota bacterium]
MRAFANYCAALLLTAALSTYVYAHCQVPCGIYGDQLRIETLMEHYVTIAKSAKQIRELSKAKDKDYNQVVRWVNNKEKHADEVAHIVTYYFMAQRVKPPKEGGEAAIHSYRRKFVLLHEMLIEAMKSKQSAEDEPVQQLRKLTLQFHEAYFTDADKKHLEQHQLK